MLFYGNKMASSNEYMFDISRSINFQFTTPFYAVIQSCALALMYVGSLYINASPFPRDHPITIKKRFQAVLFVCLSTPIMVFLWSVYPDQQSINQSFPLHRWLGIHFSNIFLACFLPLALTIVLFLGPLLQHIVDEEQYSDGEDGSIGIKIVESLGNVVWWRNFVVAPLTEEFVFRACMLPLLVPAFGVHTSIFLCPLFFGIAHVHHAIEGLRVGLPLKTVIIRTAFQMSYTTLFGAYSAFLFLRTGHLIGPVLCHCFCNMMGFPEFGAIAVSRFPKVVSAGYIIGLISFVYLLFPLTQPRYFSSIYWTASRT